MKNANPSVILSATFILASLMLIQISSTAQYQATAFQRIDHDLRNG
jgi:hypothetical protein